MRLLVTGSRGQLARSLAERCRAHPGLEVVLVGRPALDLEIAGSATRAIEAHRPDVVINAAAYTAVDQAEDEPGRALRINGEAAGEIAAVARAAGARIIQISTDYVLGGGHAGAADEHAPLAPLSVYGRSKLAGEQAVRLAAPDHVVVRTAWVYSPFGRNFVQTMIERARDRDTLRVVDDQVGSPTSALDLADGLLALAAAWAQGSAVGLGETYHLAGAGATSWFGLAQAVMAECAAAGLPTAAVEAIGTAQWPTRATRPRNSALNSGKFACDVGFRMPSWEASLGGVVRRIARNG